MGKEGKGKAEQWCVSSRGMLAATLHKDEAELSDILDLKIPAL